jgi:hypothetical protein
MSPINMPFLLSPVISSFLFSNTQVLYILILRYWVRGGKTDISELNGGKYFSN